MKTVRDVIEKHYIPVLAGTGPEVDRAKLRQDLKWVQKQRERHYWISLSATALLYLVGLAVLFWHFNQPTLAAGIFSAMGLSYPFLLKYLRDIGKDLTEADWLDALAANLDPETINTILAILMKSNKE